jgi:hypothetical protein
VKDRKSNRPVLQYDFNPKKLLGRILRIFVNLWGGGNAGGKIFAAAVAEDGRSYRPENFTEAAEIAVKVELPGFPPSMVPNLEALAAGVIQASEEVKADDEVRVILIILHNTHLSIIPILLHNTQTIYIPPHPFPSSPSRSRSHNSTAALLYSMACLAMR